MLFGVVSGVGREIGLGVLAGIEIVEGEGAVLEINGASYCNQWGLYGVVILCREGWRRGCSQITFSGGATPGRARSNDLAGRSTALAPACLLL